jgi:hypothetical protein
MTQHQELIELFLAHGNRLTLGEILKSRVGYEWRARASELRRQGYIFLLERGRSPSENMYSIVEPDK